MEKLFLLDAYALIFRAYYALIRAPRFNSKGQNTSAILGFVNTLEEVLKKENPTHIGVAFDPKGPTFRHLMYPAYKAQREETPEDIRKSVPIIKQIIEAYRIPIFEVPGYEADDVIGTLAKKADEKGVFCYLMTPDKDYAQLVTENVHIYRPKLGDKPSEILSPARVCEKYEVERPEQVIDLLGLMGDASDNIPGCPGVGEKTAKKLIATFGGVEGLLSRTDELKGALKEKVVNNVEQIRMSRELATICREVPIDLDMEALRRCDPDEERLQALYQELEFRSLLRRGGASSPSAGGATAKTAPSKASSAPTPPLFGDLFGEPASPSSSSAPTPRPDSGQLDLFGAQPENTLFSASENAKNAGGGTGGSDFSILTGFNSPSFREQVIDSKEKRAEKIAEISASDFFLFSVQTDRRDAINAIPQSLTLCTGAEETFLFPLPPERASAETVLAEFAPLFHSSKQKIGQDMKFDVLVLMNYGVVAEGPFFDTMIARYVLQPELRYEKEPSLPAVLLAKQQLEKELAEAGAEHLFFDIEMPLVRVLANMERNGARVDTESLKETARLFNERMKETEQEIYSLAGTTFNIASPKQVGEVLFEQLHVMEKPKKTKTGQYVTSEEVLQSLRAKHPVVEKILAHRGLKKLIGTYVEPLPSLINPRTGHIHTSFNQTVTATGRLSSSNPNLQNIPVRDDDGKEIRKAFIPDDGCLFFSADYSQIELRIMAHLSSDPGLIEAFLLGEDVHAATAAKVFRKPLSEVTREERARAKTANFGIIYGISAFGLAERMGVSRTEAKELIENYYATYPGIREYEERCKEKARRDGYVETIFHRKRFLPDINSHNATVRGYAERNAVNAPIQGSAADIIKVAMNEIDVRFRQDGIRSKMILQVHDELDFSVFPDEKERVEAIVLAAMQGAFAMQVPLVADCGWGANWLEAH